jgi:hypothetical protein
LEKALRKRYRGRFEVFLDSDDLFDLSTLKENVKDSQVLVLLLTKGVFTRPWCLMEIKTAIENNVPVVPIIMAGKEYDFEKSALFLKTMTGSSLDARNPGASEALKNLGVSIAELSELLSNNIPNAIAREFNSNGTRRQIDASINDIIDALMNTLSKTGHQVAISVKAAQITSMPTADIENPTSANEIMMKPMKKSSATATARSGATAYDDDRAMRITYRSEILEMNQRMQKFEESTLRIQRIEEMMQSLLSWKDKVEKKE